MESVETMESTSTTQTTNAGGCVYEQPQTTSSVFCNRCQGITYVASDSKTYCRVCWVAVVKKDIRADLAAGDDSGHMCTLPTMTTSSSSAAPTYYSAQHDYEYGFQAPPPPPRPPNAPPPYFEKKDSRTTNAKITGDRFVATTPQPASYTTAYKLYPKSDSYTYCHRRRQLKPETERWQRQRQQHEDRHREHSINRRRGRPDSQDNSRDDSYFQFDGRPRRDIRPFTTTTSSSSYKSSVKKMPTFGDRDRSRAKSVARSVAVMSRANRDLVSRANRDLESRANRDLVSVTRPVGHHQHHYYSTVPNTPVDNATTTTMRTTTRYNKTKTKYGDDMYTLVVEKVFYDMYGANMDYKQFFECTDPYIVVTGVDVLRKPTRHMSKAFVVFKKQSMVDFVIDIFGGRDGALGLSRKISCQRR